MNVIDGTVKDGLVVLDEPAALPDGTRVRVVPVVETDDDEGPATQDVIAARLALMDQLEPGWLSTEDDAAWRAALQEQKEFEKARFLVDAEKLRRMWESPWTNRRS
jgi:hypothetical protein